MIKAVSNYSVNSNKNLYFSGKNPTLQPKNGQKSEKSDLSTNEKYLLGGLAATALAVVGGLLVKKHCDVQKRLNAIIKQSYDKPEIFNEDYVSNLAKEWIEKGKMNETDAVICLPKQMLEQLLEKSDNSDLRKAYNKMNLSENAFALAPIEQGDVGYTEVKLSSIKFVEPKVQGMLAVIHNLKKGTPYFFVQELL